MFLPVVKPIVRTILRILSIILFILTVLCAYSGRINPAYSSVSGIAVMALPYMAIATMIVTVLWFVAGRWITGAIGALALVGAWGPIASAVPFKFSRNPREGKDSFTLMSWNWLDGIDIENKPDLRKRQNKSIDYILEQNADIVALQECEELVDSITPYYSSYENRLRKQYPYIVKQPRRDSHILSKFPVTNIPSELMAMKMLGHDAGGSDSMHLSLHRYTFYEVNVRGHKLLLVSVHLFSPGLSNEERNVMTGIKGINSAKSSYREFRGQITNKIRTSLVQHAGDLTLLCEILKKYTGPVVICGDFNDVPESYALRIMTANGFKDAYAETGFGHMITYNKHLFWLHIDQIMYRGALRPLYVKKGYIKTSDHYPLKAAFEFD